MPRFISACVGVDGFLQDLAKVKKGVLGLARTAISLPTQLTLCLPSTSKYNKLGDLFVGGGSFYLPPHDASKFLSYTPIVTNPLSAGPIFDDDDPSSEYFIDDKSIKVDGKIVNLNTCLLSIDKQGNGGSKLSTVVPYTKLHTLI